MTERTGIVLTAGVVQKERFGRTIKEPDKEGKVRCLGALDDFVKGEIKSIVVSGGLLLYGEPTSKPYVDYIRRQTRRYSFDPERIKRIPGRSTTTTDLKRAVEILGHRQMENSDIYTSGYHLEREIPRLATLGVRANGRRTEEITRNRSHRHGPIVDKIMKEVEERTKKHEVIGRMFVSIDLIPVFGWLHIGLRLEEALALRKKGE